MNDDEQRQHLLQALESYTRVHPERSDTAQRIASFVRSTPDCFRRNHPAGHITGSAWLLNPDRSAALLTLHHKLRLWLQLGGHVEPGESPLAAALREAAEESGIPGVTPLLPGIIDVDIHSIPARPALGEPAHLHYDIRYLLIAPHMHFALSAESDALSWRTIEELERDRSLFDDSVLRLIRLWKMWLNGAKISA